MQIQIFLKLMLYLYNVTKIFKYFLIYKLIKTFRKNLEKKCNVWLLQEQCMYIFGLLTTLILKAVCWCWLYNEWACGEDLGTETQNYFSGRAAINLCSLQSSMFNMSVFGLGNPKWLQLWTIPLSFSKTSKAWCQEEGMLFPSKVIFPQHNFE